MSTEENETQPSRGRPAFNAQTPTSEQLAAERSRNWHQDGNALLSIEALRAWLQANGLVFFLPRPQLGAPAPSLVESTLGKAEAAPELADQQAARSLLARLIAEGSAVPLNLLGATGGAGTDVPDFVVSAAVFSYIFTLRGNKAWKQSPVTSGAVKVSPLALATYELLSAKVTLSAYDLATQLGQGVTEGAVLRALTELWSQLRVLPVPQINASGETEATLWELATGRFTKQIKAGANAGQPSALSALISLYLRQALIATEDEIESFLSPLAPRSRVRDVLHALLSARQLETLVIDGKTLLHVTGELPAFAAVDTPGDAPGDVPAESSSETAQPSNGSRIGKFAAKPGSKIGTGLRSRPASPGKPGFGRPSPAGGDRERRPFARPGAGRDAARPGPRTFDKPWNEDRPRRTANAEGGTRPPRRDFPSGADGPPGTPKRTFSKPGTFGRKREGFAGAPPSQRDGAARREGGGDRPPRREQNSAGSGFKRPGSYTPRSSGADRGSDGDRPQRPARPPFPPRNNFRSNEGGSNSEPKGAETPRKVFRKFDAPRTARPSGDRPGGPAFRGRTDSKPGEGAAGQSESFSRPRYQAGEGSKRPFPGSRPSNNDRPSRPSQGFAGKGSSRGPGRPASGTSSPAGRPSAPGVKRPFSKSAGFAAKGGPFAKFADGKKPFRKPGAPKKPLGGAAPTRRKRDEDAQ